MPPNLLTLTFTLQPMPQYSTPAGDDHPGSFLSHTNSFKDAVTVPKIQEFDPPHRMAPRWAGEELPDDLKRSEGNQQPRQPVEAVGSRSLNAQGVQEEQSPPEVHVVGVRGVRVSVLLLACATYSNALQCRCLGCCRGDACRFEGE